MISCLTALLYGLWFLFVFFAFNFPTNKIFAGTPTRYRHEGKDKPLFAVIAILIMAISVATGNFFLLLVGLICSYFVPKFLIQKKQHYSRLNFLFRLTDPLRMLLSRLPDQQSVTKAMEITRDEISETSIRSLFDDYIYDIAVGSSVKDSLFNMKRKVGLRKFDVFIDNLTQSHYEGFTAAALKALDKSVEAMELDLREIQKVKEQSRAKKKKLYMATGTVWLFPPILSAINSGSANIFLATIQGKILVMLYCIGTVYVFIKGEEYLSLNLDEL